MELFLYSVYTWFFSFTYADFFHAVVNLTETQPRRLMTTVTTLTRSPWLSNICQNCSCTLYISTWHDQATWSSRSCFEDGSYKDRRWNCSFSAWKWPPFFRLVLIKRFSCLQNVSCPASNKSTITCLMMTEPAFQHYAGFTNGYESFIISCCGHCRALTSAGLLEERHY